MRQRQWGQGRMNWNIREVKTNRTKITTGEESGFLPPCQSYGELNKRRLWGENNCFRLNCLRYLRDTQFQVITMFLKHGKDLGQKTKIGGGSASFVRLFSFKDLNLRNLKGRETKNLQCSHLIKIRNFIKFQVHTFCALNFHLTFYRKT